MVSRKAKGALVAALVAVVGMAFRVSWNALRDVAEAVGADETAGLLYAFVVDGLMALALIATLVLTGDDKRFALRVLAAYTLASLTLNYVHGLVPSLHSVEPGQPVALARWEWANWALVLLATSLPVGAIYFGSDLVAKVLHHHPSHEQVNTPTPTVDAAVSTPADTPVAHTPSAASPEPEVNTPTAQVNTHPEAEVSTTATEPHTHSDTTPQPQQHAESAAPAEEADESEQAEKPLVICRKHLPALPEVPERPRLDTAAAMKVIEEGWKNGLSLREAARRATRSPSYVQQVYTRLDTDRGPRPVPGQPQLVKAASE